MLRPMSSRGCSPGSRLRRLWVFARALGLYSSASGSFHWSLVVFCSAHIRKTLATHLEHSSLLVFCSAHEQWSNEAQGVVRQR